MASRIKIKIRVVDEDKDFKIWLPAIPFWVITSLSSIALRFKSRILKNASNLDEDSRKFLDVLDSGMIRQLFEELKMLEKFDLVDLSTGSGTKIKISVL